MQRALPYIQALTLFLIVWDVFSVILFVKNNLPFGKDTLDQNESMDAVWGAQRPSDRIGGTGDMSTDSGSNTPGWVTCTQGS